MQFSNVFTCYKCLRSGEVFADNPEGVYRIAHHLGWRQATPTADHPADESRVICSRCPGGNARGNLSLQQAENMERCLQAAMRDPDFRAEMAEADRDEEKRPLAKPQVATPAAG